MPKNKIFQCSGAQKRRVAKERADRERNSVSSIPKLDRFFMNSTAVTATSNESEQGQIGNGDDSYVPCTDVTSEEPEICESHVVEMTTQNSASSAAENHYVEDIPYGKGSFVLAF
jgi:hypothetical protein